jgi:serine/threonine protein kinase
MDFCDGGSLRDLIDERYYEVTADGSSAPLPLFDGASSAQLVRDAAYGLKAVHGAKIIHSDLKSPNVLLVEDGSRASGCRALIGDFGWSQVVRSSRGSLTSSGAVGSNGGTEHWMAPEQIDAQKLTSAADMYSLGCVIWELATGLVPWSDPETGVPLKTGQVMRKVVDKGERLAFPPECSSGNDPLWIELVAIAHECFETDPTKRPTAEAVAARLGVA